jgi:hypothetical protein
MSFTRITSLIQFTVCFNVKKLDYCTVRRTVPAPDGIVAGSEKKETATDSWMYRHFPRLMAMK